MYTHRLGPRYHILRTTLPKPDDSSQAIWQPVRNKLPRFSTGGRQVPDYPWEINSCVLPTRIRAVASLWGAAV